MPLLIQDTNPILNRMRVCFWLISVVYDDMISEQIVSHQAIHSVPIE